MCSEHVCPVTHKEHTRLLACKEHIFPEVSLEFQTDCVCTCGDKDVSETSETYSLKGEINGPSGMRINSELRDWGADELVWPWEPGGCSDLGEHVVHIDLVTKGEDFKVVSCDISKIL